MLIYYVKKLLTTKNMHNYGLIYSDKRETDYLFGAENPVVKRVLLNTGDWSSYRPTPESQAYVYFDDYGCVTHSAVTILASILERQIEMGLISNDNIAWLKNNGYYDENGKINFNDRYIITLSNTICNLGNYLHIVADTIRAYGLIPQSAWNYGKDEFKSCEDFMKRPSDNLIKFGQEFKERFQVNYELVNARDSEAVTHSLKYSPLQVIVKAWTKNKDGLYYNTKESFNHAVALYKYEWVWDSYSDYDNTPFEKQLTPDYLFGQWAYAFFINEIRKEKNMITYKKQGSSAVYLPVGTKLIPFNTTWQVYQKDFAEAVLIELSDDEFKRFTVVDSVKVTSARD